MESLIADEQPTTVPIVFKGSGPRVLICCLYNEDAMEAGRGIDPLNSNPTAGDWRITAPCEADDVDWMNNTLKDRAPRITIVPDRGDGAVLNAFEKCLAAKYGADSVDPGRRCITVEFEKDNPTAEFSY